ncbi:PilZ domain-containing protein [Thalassotalea agarivorans]|uniref:Protein YcgR n=1 Tax=Thalassotalea agarivorans TaxID=349064 RepID=A0A1H9ZU97_THASX|nr:PilZ domain-containing protein [Thalassotalea agarivorans]SES84406.1 protein YcgR [Thalassotalea agarivorans]
MSTQALAKKTNIFELLPGKLIDIQVNQNDADRLKLPLVGYAFGRYIILKYPVGTRAKDFAEALMPGNSLFVRYILDDGSRECFSFVSQVKDIIECPEKCIIIDYPTRINNRQLRRHQRTQTHLPAIMRFVDPKSGMSVSQANGIIVDISPEGCGFTFKHSGDVTKLNETEVQLCVQSPIEGDIEIPAMVCNVRQTNGKVSIGIKFFGDGKQVERLLVHLFIELL